MNLLEILLVSVGLAMDAFAVSVCKGLSMKMMDWKKAIIVGSYFGIFQMVMPIIGYMLGIGFSSFIENVDHWIAFGLLAFIGAKMIKESFQKEEKINDSVDFKTMYMLAIATSIDALAIGITYAFLEVENYMLAFACIGVITFILSIIGVKIGNRFGNKYGSNAEFVGGFILVCLGVKILIEHLWG